jgi:hypothetical protein
MKEALWRAGGIVAHEAVLPFDSKKYPQNPSIASARVAGGVCRAAN